MHLLKKERLILKGSSIEASYSIFYLRGVTKSPASTGEITAAERRLRFR